MSSYLLCGGALGCGSQKPKFLQVFQLARLIGRVLLLHETRALWSQSSLIPALLPSLQLCRQRVPRAAHPTLSARRTTRASASPCTMGMGSHAQVSSHPTHGQKAGSALLHLHRNAVTAHYETFPVQPKNFCCAAAGTNLGYTEFRFF